MSVFLLLFFEGVHISSRFGNRLFLLKVVPRKLSDKLKLLRASRTN